MNNDVKKIKEDIMKTCSNSFNCNDCPYSIDYGMDCCAPLVFNNKDVPFTPGTVFFEMFKKAIIKECETTGDCKSCKDLSICWYHRTIPEEW